jgi:hypothetical protein
LIRPRIEQLLSPEKRLWISSKLGLDWMLFWTHLKAVQVRFDGNMAGMTKQKSFEMIVEGYPGGGYPSGNLGIGSSGDRKNNMRLQGYSNDTLQCRMPEARYAYYRRCQVFRRNGEQCKAPAEKDTHICYAHARQEAIEAHRVRERRAVLEQAALVMRQRGHEEFEVGHIFHDFNAIQATLAVVMRAIINGRIDSKTAGRLLWELQIASKLLRLQQRAATVATRRYSSRGLEEPSLQNVGVPIRAAEQILQPHAADLEDRICHASSASGWRLEEEAVTTEQRVIDTERAALIASHFEEICQTCHAERRASPGEAGTAQVEASREFVHCDAALGSSLPYMLAMKSVAAVNDAVSVELPDAA